MTTITSRWPEAAAAAFSARAARRQRHTITAVAKSPKVAGATASQFMSPGELTAAPTAA